jgi:hypothetical protein
LRQSIEADFRKLPALLAELRSVPEAPPEKPSGSQLSLF